ncbi:MAG: hypothetical protein ABI655_07300, partial [Phenylobacterium sp.]
MEISGKHAMTLNGGDFRAGAADGRVGTVLFDPDTLTINASVASHGANLAYTADSSIEVATGVTIDAKATAPLAAGATRSGDISLTAPTITLDAGSILDASATGQYGAGSITLTATQSNSAVQGLVTSGTAITLSGQLLATPSTTVTDTGGAITVTATSSAISSYSDNSTAMIVGSIGSALPGLTGFNAAYVAADATAAITVAGTAKISGGAVTLTATNTATASDPAIGLASPLGLGAGVVVGKLTSNANVAVQASAQITATGALDITASNAATLDVSAYSISAGQSALNIAVALSWAKIQSSATIASGAAISAGSLNLIATNTNSFSTVAEADAYGGGRAGVAFALADGLSTTATATNGANLGSVDAKIGAVTIEADSITTKNVTSAASQVGNSALVNLFIGDGAALAGVTTLFSGVPNIATKLGGDSGSSPKIGSAVALTLDQQHTAAASLDGGGGTAPTIISSGDVTVSGRVIDKGLRNNANSGIASGTGSATSPSASVAISAAVAYGDYTHTATALVGDGVQITAANIGVAATNSLPVDINWLPTDASYDGALGGFNFLKTHLNGSGGVVGTILTSYANAASSETGLVLAGAVNYLDVTDTTQAWVGKNAKLTSAATAATPAWSTALANGDALDFATAVTVQANASIDTIDVEGSPLNALAGPSNPGGVAVGALFGYTSYTSDTTAGIGAGATISVPTAGLTVEATSTDTVFALAVGAGIGAGTSLDGSLALVIMDEDTHASISNTATVSAASVAVKAAEDLSVWAVGGDLSASTGASAVGMTAGVVQATTDTQAFIGDNDADRPTGSGTATGVAAGSVTTPVLGVTAVTAGSLGSAAVAATAATSSDAPPDDAGGGGSPDAADDASGALSGFGAGIESDLNQLFASDPVGAAGAPATSKSFGIAVSGAAAVTLPTLSTKAFLDGATVVNANTTVQALNNTLLDAGAGSAALSAAVASNSQNSAAIGGVVAFQSSQNLTSASIHGGSTLSNLAGLQVLALSGGRRTAVAVAGAVSVSTSSNSTATA